MGTGVSITYLGQSTFRFVTPEGRIVLIDPLVASNPLCPEDEKDVRAVDLILITHAHWDHLGDVLEIAGRLSPTVVAVVELGKWLATRGGLSNVQIMNIGGILHLDGVTVTMTQAAHSSSLEDEPHTYVGLAAGFVLEFSDGTRIYHAGDTAAFSGMELIHQVHRPEVAMLPIGDHHTMGPLEAAYATRLLNVERVIPMHYGITPGSETTPAAYRAALDSIGLSHVETIEMTPGQTIAWDHRPARRRDGPVASRGI
jgi:L-ascorbate metabolism protein UlaG (beta-lactamase superfamily)